MRISRVSRGKMMANDVWMSEKFAEIERLLRNLDKRYMTNVELEIAKIVGFKGITKRMIDRGVKNALSIQGPKK